LIMPVAIMGYRCTTVPSLGIGYAARFTTLVLTSETVTNWKHPVWMA
jgi:hypothetical protein